jgi:hypothetical protein
MWIIWIVSGRLINSILFRSKFKSVSMNNWGFLAATTLSSLENTTFIYLWRCTDITVCNSENAWSFFFLLGWLLTLRNSHKSSLLFWHHTWIHRAWNLHINKFNILWTVNQILIHLHHPLTLLLCFVLPLVTSHRNCLCQHNCIRRVLVVPPLPCLGWLISRRNPTTMHPHQLPYL